MSKLPTTPDKPTLTAEEEARIDEVLKSDAPAPLKALEVVTTALAPMVRHYAALEAAKTPEQRAEEARQQQVDAERRAKEKRDKQTAKWRKLYGKWCSCDTWLLESEAVPLALEEEPSWLLLIDGADEMLKRAISCAG